MDRPEFHRHSWAVQRVALFELYRGGQTAGGTVTARQFVEHLHEIEHTRSRGCARRMAAALYAQHPAHRDQAKLAMKAGRPTQSGFGFNGFVGLMASRGQYR